MLNITQIAVLPHNSNYNYILHDNGITSVIDPSLAEPVLEVLKQNGWQLDYIINTHHHWDHTDGNTPLKDATGAKIIAYKGDSHRIKNIDIAVNNGDIVDICGHRAEVIFTPGHTLGHIIYYLPDDGILFCGDVLFSLGCGRLFEGSYEQMFDSLKLISRLPPQTLIYCGHEYTLSNARFAITIEPENKELQQRIKEAENLQAIGKPSVPVTLASELATNPFLRARTVEEFANLRKQKDSFK